MSLIVLILISNNCISFELRGLCRERLEIFSFDTRRVWLPF